MADADTEEGPKVVWTFPLARQFQSDSGILQLGSRIGSMLSSDGGVVGGGAMRERMKERRERATGSDDDSSSRNDDEIDNIESEVDNLSESSESIFGSSEEESLDYGSSDNTQTTNEVTIDNDAFIPTQLNINEGETVVWDNPSDETYRVVSVSGEELDSGQLEPGDSYEHTFDEEGVTVYVESMRGGSEMSGAIIVGDAEMEGDLPSDDDVDPVLFEDDQDSQSGTRTMEQAAEDKEEMELGFDN